MTLSAPVRYSMRDVQTIGYNSYPVRSGVTIYHGALVGLSTVGVTDGRLVNWSSGSGALRFIGLAIPNSPTVVGNAAGSVECPVLEGGVILEDVSVTGAESAQNVGDPVYASDENTFTLSATSNVGAVGVVDRYKSGTSCDVRLYSRMEYNALQEVGKV